jgi:uncharacterized protein
VRLRALLVIGVLAACARGSRYVPPSQAKLVVVPVGFAPPDTDKPVVYAELATTPEARQRGLGRRTKVDPGEGMLFVYEAPEPRRFWMKDCLVGLDIAFLHDDGRVVSIDTLAPGFGLDDKDVPGVTSTVPVRYVLETPAGWLAGQGVHPGDVVDLSRALDDARRR